MTPYVAEFRPSTSSSGRLSRVGTSIAKHEHDRERAQVSPTSVFGGPNGESPSTSSEPSSGGGGDVERGGGFEGGFEGGFDAAVLQSFRGRWQTHEAAMDAAGRDGARELERSHTGFLR